MLGYIFCSAPWFSHLVSGSTLLEQLCGYFLKRRFFSFENQQWQQASCRALMPMHLSFQRRLSVFVAHPSVSCSMPSGRIFNKQGTKTWEKTKWKQTICPVVKHKPFAAQGREQLLASELQHYTTVNGRKQRTLLYPFAVVGETRRNRMRLARWNLARAMEIMALYERWKGYFMNTSVQAWRFTLQIS